MKGFDDYFDAFNRFAFNERKIEEVDLTLTLDQFEPMRADFNPSQYVINMEEGSDGVWQAKSVTIRVQFQAP